MNSTIDVAHLRREPAFLGKFATAAALDVVTTVSVLVPLLRELGERANKSGADGAFGMTADGKRTRDGSFISFPVPSAADSPSSSLDERLELPQTAAKSTSEGTDGDLDGKLAAGVGGGHLTCVRAKG